MRKLEISDAPSHEQAKGDKMQQGRTMEKALLIGICLFVSVVFFRGPSFPESRPQAMKQGNITWVSCDNHIQCGELEVPLDYFDPSVGKAKLALARYPASNRTGRIGTLLMNPGGPGGSGVSLVYRLGERVSKLLDGKYDIVSWDPRGVNGTSPRVDCFPSKSEQDIARANTHEEIGMDIRDLSDPYDLAAFNAILKLADARNEAWVRTCENRSGDVMKYVGTASVVRDIDLLTTELEGEDAAINYWGLSYGTVVGSYLVNMFPNRIGRVVIDAVVDPVMWANSLPTKWWKWQLADTEKALHNFYEACAKAGPYRCALASKASTGQEMAILVDDLIGTLYERPLAVYNSTRPGPLTSGMLQAAIFIALYRPLDWPSLAINLVKALEGNGAPLVNQFLKEISLNKSMAAPTVGSTYAVICTDSPGYDELNRKNALQEFINESILARQVSAHFFGLRDSRYQHVTVRSVERFTGPFNHTLNNEILIIGNTADPITPVQNAKKVNELLHHSSRLVIQDGSGHGSVAMSSLCTTKVLRDYFLDGKLPENGIVCPTDEILFPPNTASPEEEDELLWSRKNYSAEELKLLRIARELGKAWQSESQWLMF